MGKNVSFPTEKAKKRNLEKKESVLSLSWGHPCNTSHSRFNLPWNKLSFVDSSLKDLVFYMQVNGD